VSLPPADPNLAYAVSLVHATCCLAGSPSYLDDIRYDLRLRGIPRAVKDHDTPALFDWLMELLSFQGISDSVAAGYIAQHGTVRWADIAAAVSRRPSCPKLTGYWTFTDCRYHKTTHTCFEPAHIETCPLPRHPLRNGRLNQTAYSLFLFIRDVADGDLVAWIDQQLNAANSESSMSQALVSGQMAEEISASITGSWTSALRRYFSLRATISRKNMTPNSWRIVNI
jgi:hypothetical protein